VSTAADDFDPDAWTRWSPAAREELLGHLRDAEVPRRVWYCNRGRTCDGKPHEGAAEKHCRGAQYPPPGTDWLVWLNSSGRGAGKTRGAAEYTRKVTDRVRRIALVGATGPDVRDTMIEGESGLIYVCERAGAPIKWESSKRKITFANGAEGHTYSAEEPDRLRGPQHGYVWGDEPAHWDNVEECWDNILLGLRLGLRPHVALTTTPLPIPWIRTLAEDPTTIVTRESTYANLANLPEIFARKIIAKYEGTRKGKQELLGEILEDVEGALWNQQMILDASIDHLPDHFDRVVVAVDPAGTSKERSDETGIVVLARAEDLVYVLADHSGKYTPNAWASKVATLYDLFSADVVVAENNYGGEMVTSTLRNARQFMRVQEVNSRRGKLIRAEPVVALYEQQRIKHAADLTNLEDQLLSWVPGKGKSPDRLDALVHGVHALVRTERPVSMAKARPTPMRRVVNPHRNAALERMGNFR
jgi:phage terminase large subunit-like protein